MAIKLIPELRPDATDAQKRRRIARHIRAAELLETRPRGDHGRNMYRAGSHREAARVIDKQSGFKQWAADDSVTKRKRDIEAASMPDRPAPHRPYSPPPKVRDETPAMRRERETMAAIMPGGRHDREMAEQRAATSKPTTSHNERVMAELRKRRATGLDPHFTPEGKLREKQPPQMTKGRGGRVEQGLPTKPPAQPKAPKQAKSIQVGKKGGRYYVSAAGRKIYIR